MYSLLHFSLLISLCNSFCWDLLANQQRHANWNFLGNIAYFLGNITYFLGKITYFLGKIRNLALSVPLKVWLHELQSEVNQLLSQTQTSLFSKTTPEWGSYNRNQASMFNAVDNSNRSSGCCDQAVHSCHGSHLRSSLRYTWRIWSESWRSTYCCRKIWHTVCLEAGSPPIQCCTRNINSISDEGYICTGGSFNCNCNTSFLSASKARSGLL